MSYSVCLACRNMVGGYEKYCDKCAEDHKQDFHFWKTHDYSYLNDPHKRSVEILRDTIDVDEATNDKED